MFARMPLLSDKRFCEPTPQEKNMAHSADGLHNHQFPAGVASLETGF